MSKIGQKFDRIRFFPSQMRPQQQQQQQMTPMQLQQQKQQRMQLMQQQQQQQQWNQQQQQQQGPGGSRLMSALNPNQQQKPGDNPTLKGLLNQGPQGPSAMQQQQRPQGPPQPQAQPGNRMSALEAQLARPPSTIMGNPGQPQVLMFQGMIKIPFPSQNFLHNIIHFQASQPGESGRVN